MRQPRLILVIVSLAALALAALLAGRFATARAVGAERVRLGGVAALAAGSYRRQVEKFELVVTTLSADPGVSQTLMRPTPPARLQLNQRLAPLSAALDASVIYVMDLRGDTIAASNWRQPDSFVDQNYAFRAYFRDALRDGAGNQFAQGTRSHIPGLYIARRIDGAAGPLGVVVVKVRFDRLEREWARDIGSAFVTDRDGVVLLTSNPDWRFTVMGEMPPARRDALRASNKFGDAALGELPAWSQKQILLSGAWNGERWLAATVPATGEDRLTVLAPATQTVRGARNTALLAVALAATLLVTIAVILNARRRAVLAQAERGHRRRLDELSARLEQANRLSFLGQIAAGVGHEINQPLAAIGTRAANAKRLLELGRSQEARGTLDEIAALVARVGAITGELRGFARRGERKIGSVPLRAALTGLALLMSDRLRQLGAALNIAVDDEAVLVAAEQGRLEQVLVNLVSNALEAGGQGTVVDIAVATGDDAVKVTIADDGPGISPEVRAALFQPFTTSKADGLGLGLVISRDIVAAFGGELILLEPAGGAAFLLVLRRAT